MGTFTLILAAAGEGRRLGAATAKAFLPLGGRPMLEHTMERFDGAGRITERVVAVRPGDVDRARSCLARWEPTIVEGGRRRQDSVKAALDAAAAEYVVVHDAARPFVSGELIERVLDEAERTGAAIAAVAVTDTVKQVQDGAIVRTVPRGDLWAAQTPQAFKTSILREAFARAREDAEATDSAQLVEALGLPVRIVPASAGNGKITSPEDLARAGWILERAVSTQKNGSIR
jgi:2-C-methyl-D-erythritol 4-phosphate cytidylyltransferase